MEIGATSKQVYQLWSQFNGKYYDERVAIISKYGWGEVYGYWFSDWLELISVNQRIKIYNELKKLLND